MKNPIIFLNIDGVLISEDYILKESSNLDNLYTKIDGYYYMNFEKNKIDLIKKLINDTYAYIVIVSHWCEHNDLNTIKKIFSKYNLDDKIIDIVPYNTVRSGNRVNKWLKEEIYKYSFLNNEKFVIIDNDDTGILKNKHVKCNSKLGLTNNDIKVSKKLLKK